MGVNLTSYNGCFKTLDPNYDPIVKTNKNIIDSSKETFENTKRFVDLLNRHSNDFSYLNSIASRISTLNDYFCTLLGTKTNINLDSSRTIEDLKTSAKLSHQLAKSTLANIPEFIESINKTIEEMKKDLATQSQIRINPDLDAVDIQLLTGSHIEAPLLSKKFGSYQPNSPSAERGGHRDRSVNSLLNEEGFCVTVKVNPELHQIVKSLGKFAYMVQANDYKLGL